MKNVIFFVFLLFFSESGLGQTITTITGKVSGAEDTTLRVKMTVYDPLILTREAVTIHEIITRKGKFEFSLIIDKPTKIGLRISDKYVTFPGVYHLLVEPSDSIHISVPEFEKAGHFGYGIMNVLFSGKGSEKLDLTKSMATAMLNIFKTDPKFETQTIAFQYETTDRKLRAIDSVYTHYSGSVSSKVKDIIRAQLYNGLLDGLFYSSLYTENDSLRALFTKYIVDKNRMDVFYKDDIIYYFGGGLISDYILLSEFNNPVQVGGRNYKRDHALEFAQLKLKYLHERPIVKDYSLSEQTLGVIRELYDSSISTKLFKFYREHTNADNPFSVQVTKMYDDLSKKFKKGSRFYPFELPDPDGKIHRLADFKGKLVILDFWFNGCGSCKQMVPFMQELENEYEKKGNIQFISVSVDKTKELWLDGIGKYSSPKSLQLFTEGLVFGHPLIKYMNLRGCPFLLVLDKNGNVVGTPPDPRSQKTEFIKFIEKYI